jgi:two-component system LytT family response regulator
VSALRVLLVDDERPARAKMRRLLGEIADVEIIGEADGGAAAVDAIRTLAPDLVFLDVQMPGLDGFGVLAALDGEPLPRVVFVTAFDEYAVRAFDVNALDYLLKPVDPRRLAATVERARAARATPATEPPLDARIAQLLRQLDRAPRFLERVVVTEGEGDRSIFLKLADVARIESDRNYVTLHTTAGRRYTLRRTLAALEERLDPERFLRINRSEIVSLEAIAHLEPWFHGEYRVVLRDGTRTTWSRRYLDRVPEILRGR